MIEREGVIGIGIALGELKDSKDELVDVKNLPMLLRLQNYINTIIDSICKECSRMPMS